MNDLYQSGMKWGQILFVYSVSNYFTEMVIANLGLRATSAIYTTPYPTRARGIIVKCIQQVQICYLHLNILNPFFIYFFYKF